MAELHSTTKPYDTRHTLSRAFDTARIQAIKHIGAKAIRTTDKNGNVITTKMYDYQVEFCHLLRKFQTEPNYIKPKIADKITQLISDMGNE